MTEQERDEYIRRRAKQLMRRRFRGHRGALPRSAAKARSEQLCQRLLQRQELQHATDVAMFWPMEQRNEVDLRPLHAALRERGCTLWYPRTNMESGTMTFHRLDRPEDLQDGPYGTQQPPADAPTPDMLDVVVVPGLAFDGAGYRIGYGGGFYDRTLPNWCPPAHAIGVAFDFQLAAEIPRDENDVAVNTIVTDRRELTASET